MTIEEAIAKHPPDVNDTAECYAWGIYGILQESTTSALNPPNSAAVVPIARGAYHAAVAKQKIEAAIAQRPPVGSDTAEGYAHTIFRALQTSDAANAPDFATVAPIARAAYRDVRLFWNCRR